MGNWAKKDGGGSDLSTINSRQANAVNYNNTSNVGHRQYDPEPPTDGNINAILEMEEALIAAHRKEIEDTMEIVREEMKLLAEVDQPGSLIDNFVTQLSFVLSRKAAGLVSLHARLVTERAGDTEFGREFLVKAAVCSLLSLLDQTLPFNAWSCFRVLRGNSAMYKSLVVLAGINISVHIHVSC
ncbi:hypothetical protein CRYUN_Cryun18bG0014900 [Craigia yunnanensis]